MTVSRRIFLAGLAGLPALHLVGLTPAPALAPALARRGAGPASVGEVWGLRFFAEGAVPAATAAAPRKRRSAVPAWHPEFT